MDQSFWRKCTVCKSEINFSTKYYMCSISGCSKKRAPVQFCTVSCWSTHNEIYNHKSAWAEEEMSLTKLKWEEQNSMKDLNSNPRRRIVTTTNKADSSQISSDLSQNVNQEDILVVASKLKNYIKERSGLNTSADVLPALSDIMREKADSAIHKARRDGRKTVMARDF